MVQVSWVKPPCVQPPLAWSGVWTPNSSMVHGEGCRAVVQGLLGLITYERTAMSHQLLMKLFYWNLTILFYVSELTTTLTNMFLLVFLLRKLLETSQQKMPWGIRVTTEETHPFKFQQHKEMCGGIFAESPFGHSSLQSPLEVGTSIVI